MASIENCKVTSANWISTDRKCALIIHLKENNLLCSMRVVYLRSDKLSES